MTNTEIGARIKQRREELGYTLQQVADQIGVARSTIQRYESGAIAKIKQPVITAIAGALDIPPEWLTGEQEHRTAPATSGKTTREPLVLDDETISIIDELRTRPEMRILFSVSQKASKEDILKAVRIVQALREENL